MTIFRFFALPIIIVVLAMLFAGNAVVWMGVSAGGPWDTPEDLADEEMSYWDDDGEG